MDSGTKYLTVVSRAGSNTRLARLWRSFVRWQTPYSLVSSLIALSLAVVFMFDLVFDHPGADAVLIRGWLLLFSLLAIVPLCAGRRYPGWAGLLTVGIIQAWSAYSLVVSAHVHVEINALLQLPMIALYVGWFYGTVVSRIWMIGCTILTFAALISNPGIGAGRFSPVTVVLYSVLIALFCFEGARTVRRQLFVQSITDPLTGALNRRGLKTIGEQFRRRAERRGTPLSIVLIDFDDFKLINDSGGHSAGDKVLRESVAEWRTKVGMRGRRATGNGLVARLGGDEFLLLIAGCADHATAMVEQLSGDERHSWSWGIASLAPDDNLDAVIAAADAELFRAKRAN